MNFSYDALDRLTGVSGAYSKAYAYDKLGNLTAKDGYTYAYDATQPHAVDALLVTSTAMQTFTYDANGNMLTHVVNGGAETTLTYNADNRLATATADGDTATYTYDGDTLLAQKNTPEGTTFYAGNYEYFDPNTGTVMGEVGLLDDILTHAPRTVLLEHTYINPVVFAQPLSYDSADTAVVRITDVQADRFTLYIHDAPNMGASHTTESVSYLVLGAGQWYLDDGAYLEVGTVATDLWKAVSFAGAFTSAPVVVSQVQTNRDVHWVKTRQRNATVSGFEVRLEEDDAQTAPHGVEKVGWLAIEPGQGTWNGRVYKAAQTANSVTHAWYTISFGVSFSQAPRFVGAIATYNGGDGSYLRYQNLTIGSVQVKVEEDTTEDTEVAHTSEEIAYLALAGNGTLTGSSPAARIRKYYTLNGQRVAQRETAAADVSPLKYGVACLDSASGLGYLMYSAESIHTRFAAYPPNSNNADHFICVKYSSGWKYDNGGAYYSFTPRATDILVALVNYTADTVTSAAGQTGTRSGITFGYAAGDLTYTADQWNGSSNDGEFGITGSTLIPHGARDTLVYLHGDHGFRGRKLGQCQPDHRCQRQPGE